QEALERALGVAPSAAELLRAAGGGQGPGIWERAKSADRRGAYLATMFTAQAVLGALMQHTPGLGMLTPLAALGAFFLRMRLIAIAAVAGAGYMYAQANKKQNAHLLAFAFANLYARASWGGPTRTQRLIPI